LAECEAIQPGNSRTAQLMQQLQSVVRIAENERAASQATSQDDAAGTDRDMRATPKSTTPGQGSTAAEKSVSVPALPAGAMEDFVTTIQPLLINQCGNGGCHGGTTRAQFKLQRFDSRRTPSRVYTDRNLAAVMKFIDRTNPEASPLLVMPGQPHGSAKSPIFEGRKLAHQAELALWARKAAGASASGPKSTGKRNFGGGSVAEKKTNSRAARSRVGEDISQAGGESEAGPIVNPHDPDVFNRRFFPDGRATADVPERVEAAPKFPPTRSRVASGP
jgi:hypothetical protein